LVWPGILGEIDPSRHGGGQPSPQSLKTGGGANYLYADGHVDLVAETTFYTWVQRDVAQGTNLARPTQ